MMSLRPEDAIASFDQLRPKLTRVAYRMLGSVADAEDVVQDAWLRWTQAEVAAVRDPEAFLVRTVTRLCLDVLKSARVQRETYVGAWLPEPLVDPPIDEADDVTVALMVALERLSPLERAAFLLHDVFGVGFDEISQAIGRDEAACRQLASRARRHVRDKRPRFALSDERGRDFATAFFAATRDGNVETLRHLLAEDVVFYADGGGKVPSIINPLVGRDRVVRFFQGLARKACSTPPVLVRTGRVDGLPGFVSRDGSGLLQVAALEVEDGRIVAIYLMRNPDKMRHLGLG
jgi:RNA polymerase sigma-70 factor (ECF subfamily)